MCTFYSISTFRNELSKLISLKKEGYCSVWDDITSEFGKKKDMEEIRNTPSMIKLGDNTKIIKARIPNSYLKLSKSNGYRLIYLVRLDRSEIVLLYIYPKRGKKGLIDIKESMYSHFLKEYQSEQNAGILHQHEEIIKPTQ